MTPRLKKFIALLLLLPGVAAYLLAAAVIGERVPAFWLAQVLYYLIAGVAWAFPVIGLMRWANAEPERRRAPRS